MTWKENNVKKTQENHNKQRYEEERNDPELDKGIIDTQQGMDLQKDMSGT